MIDTNVISEARRGVRANRGVVRFFRDAEERGQEIYTTAITIGELQRGVHLLRYRGDHSQAAILDAWLSHVLVEYGDKILSLDVEAAQMWGRLRVPDSQHAIDKQIAAIALVNSLTMVTRNISDFQTPGLKLENPFN